MPHQCNYEPSVLAVHCFEAVVALNWVCWTAESRQSEHEHFGGRRRVADEDDTVLDDAHESSSVASQDRGKFHNDVLHAIKVVRHLS